MLSPIIAIIGGVVAASSVIFSKKSNSTEFIDFITPYQGWIGVVLTFWGLGGIVSSFLHISQAGPTWAFHLAEAAATFIVGFLLGYGLISKYLLEKDETAKEKGQALRMKLIKYQIPSGIILIVMSVLSILMFPSQ